MTPVTAAERAMHSIGAYGTARTNVSGAPLSAEDLRKTHAYWRACNYLMLGMIYLQENPLLKEPLKAEHIKNRLLGHWGGTSQGTNFRKGIHQPVTAGAADL
jgi:xylulose-5-phosphate/fructose-6-phosphate phosphoketolase